MEAFSQLTVSSWDLCRKRKGEVAGNLVVFDTDRDSDEELAIDCTKFGSGAYSIPISVEHLRFQSDAQFILAIETAGMFQRLVKHNYWRTANCILISMGGVPTRATRRFIRRLSEELDTNVCLCRLRPAMVYVISIER